VLAQIENEFIYKASVEETVLIPKFEQAGFEMRYLRQRIIQRTIETYNTTVNLLLKRKTIISIICNPTAISTAAFLKIVGVSS
jgi:hypothetical protein